MTTQTNEMVGPDKVKELLKKRQNSLMLLSQYREQIERCGRPDANHDMPVALQRHILGAVCSYLTADFSIFLDGNLKSEPKPPAGEMEISDHTRQQFAVEIYCLDNANVRAWLETRLEEIFHGAVELHRTEIENETGGLHINRLHRVAGVIDYPKS